MCLQASPLGQEVGHLALGTTLTTALSRHGRGNRVPERARPCPCSAAGRPEPGHRSEHAWGKACGLLEAPWAQSALCAPARKSSRPCPSRAAPFFPVENLGPTQLGGESVIQSRAASRAGAKQGGVQGGAVCPRGIVPWRTQLRVALGRPAGPLPLELRLQQVRPRLGGTEARRLRLFPTRESGWLPGGQDRTRGGGLPLWHGRGGGISVSPLQEAGVQGGSPGQGAGPRTRCTHAAHPVSTHMVSGSQMSPQAGSEHPQSSGRVLGTCFPSVLLLKALCDLLQMP